MLFIFFPLFPTFLLRPMTSNFKTTLMTTERSLFVLKIDYCLLEGSNDCNHVGDHTEIWWKIVLDLFEYFTCVPCCHNDKDVKAPIKATKNNV